MSVWCAGAVNLPGKLWMEVVLWQALQAVEEVLDGACMDGERSGAPG
jgi:hypothetical protein